MSRRSDTLALSLMALVGCGVERPPVYIPPWYAELDAARSVPDAPVVESPRDASSANDVASLRAPDDVFVADPGDVPPAVAPLAVVPPDAAPVGPGGEPLATEGVLRLADGSPTRGRLEIFHSGLWGTVCDDGFGDVEATVACRQLGYRAGTSIAIYGGGAGLIWMDDVHCTGDEVTLSACGHAAWGFHNCSRVEDVGVACE